MNKLRNGGFTIVELMIATSVFSVILLLCATALISIGKTYHKGLISSKTQEAARNIMEDLTKQITFSGSRPTPISALPGPYAALAVQSFCIRDTRYTFAMDTQVSDNGLNSLVHQSFHALWRDTTYDPTYCPPADLSLLDPNTAGDIVVSGVTHIVKGVPGSGVEMLPAGVRLRNFNVSNIRDKLWKIDVGLVYGDDAVLLRNPPNTGPVIGCVTAASGGSFCALSDLSTEAYRVIL